MPWQLRAAASGLAYVQAIVHALLLHTGSYSLACLHQRLSKAYGMVIRRNRYGMVIRRNRTGFIYKFDSTFPFPCLNYFKVILKLNV